MGDSDKLVIFSLENGRRTEPVAQQQVANAVANQMALNVAADRFVLAQQLNNATDPTAVANLANARQAAFLAGLVPFGRGGAVGYMPIIITLPEGTNMVCRAATRPRSRRSVLARSCSIWVAAAAWMRSPPDPSSARGAA